MLKTVKTGWKLLKTVKIVKIWLKTVKKNGLKLFKKLVKTVKKSFTPQTPKKLTAKTY